MSVQQLESRISAEASDLLDCFSEELAEVVRDIAEDFARERVKGTNQPVEIRSGDIQRAGKTVLDHLRKAVDRGELPEHWQEAIGGMTDCMTRRDR